MSAQYTAAGEFVTPERVDEIRAEGRRQVLDVVHAALPSADANYIESRVREFTTSEGAHQTGPFGRVQAASRAPSAAAARSTASERTSSG